MRNARLPKDIVINTLFGEAIATQVCNTCDIEKPIFEYYVDSKTATKPREQCKECWKQFKGNSDIGRWALKYKGPQNA